MRKRRNLILTSIVLIFSFSLVAPTVHGKQNEYDQIVKHFKLKYQAKKVSIPFLWLAKFAVKVVRPAGVRSFKVTLFEDLKFSHETLDAEMQTAMRQSFGPEWSAIFRVRSHKGQQAYMYMREVGKNVKVTLVTVEKDQAAIIRATLSPERLADFINDPKIFGISLGSNDRGEVDKDPKHDHKN